MGISLSILTIKNGIKGYNDRQPKSRVETVTELDAAGNVVYVVYRNGVRDEKLTTQLTEAMKGSWLDRSINAVAKFLDIVGNVVKTTLGVVTTITGIIGTIGGCAVVTLATGGVGILIDGVIVTEGVALTTAGVTITVDGINGLTTSNFANKDMSTNQIADQVKKGKGPEGVKRVDKANKDAKNAQDHIHFDDFKWTLNRDGTWGILQVENLRN